MRRRRFLKVAGIGVASLIGRAFAAETGVKRPPNVVLIMADNSRPLHTYDETCHVPLVLCHPAAIPAGRTSDLMVSNYDLLPTVVSYLGLRDEIPDKPQGPGLFGRAARSAREMGECDLL